MQFTVWRFSAKSRMFIEWVITVAFAIYIHILVSRINDQIYDVFGSWTKYVVIEQKLV